MARLPDFTSNRTFFSPFFAIIAVPDPFRTAKNFPFFQTGFSSVTLPDSLAVTGILT